MACEALCAMCKDNEKCKERAVKASAIAVLIAALKRHIKMPDVVDVGSKALVAVCYTPELQQLALKAGAEPILLTAR